MLILCCQVGSEGGNNRLTDRSGNSRLQCPVWVWQSSQIVLAETWHTGLCSSPSWRYIILCLSLSINSVSHNQEQYNPIRPYIKYEGLPINKNTTTRKNFSYSNTHSNSLLWASYHWLMTENWFESSHLDQDWPPETSWLDWLWLFTNLGCQRNLAKLTSILCWRSNRGNSLLDL